MSVLLYGESPCFHYLGPNDYQLVVNPVSCIPLLVVPPSVSYFKADCYILYISKRYSLKRYNHNTNIHLFPIQHFTVSSMCKALCGFCF